jgi:hypothetical protein
MTTDLCIRFYRLYNSEKANLFKVNGADGNYL